MEVATSCELAINGKSFTYMLRSVLAGNSAQDRTPAATYCKESRMRLALMLTNMHKRFPLSVLGLALMPLVSGRIDNSSWPRSGMSNYEISVRIKLLFMASRLVVLRCYFYLVPCVFSLNRYVFRVCYLDSWLTILCSL